MKTRILALTALALAGAGAFLVSPAKTASRAPWRILGPGGGGAQYRPTISPQDPGTVLVACDMTGAYITHDSGRTWREFNLRQRVDATTFDPSHPKVIYAGSSGLFRSEDNGDHWNLVFPNPASVTGERNVGDEAEHFFVSRDNWPGGRPDEMRRHTIQAIEVDPADSSRLYIGIQAGSNLPGRQSSLMIFYSQDRGKTWTEGPRPAGQDFRRIWVAPGSQQVFVATNSVLEVFSAGAPAQSVALPSDVRSIHDFAAAFDAGTRSAVLYLAGAGAGVLKSHDLGKTWQRIQSGMERADVTQLAVASKNPKAVYAGIRRQQDRSGKNSYGIMKTEDGGGSWKWVLHVSDNTNPPNKKVGWVARAYGPGWGEFAIGLGANATGNVAYATDLGTTYRMLDGGANWEEVYSKEEPDGSSASRGLDVTTCYGMHFDPFDRNHLVISYTDIGMFQSFNGGRSWVHAIQGVPRPWINTAYWMVFDPEVKGRAWSVWGNRHDLPRIKMYRGRVSLDRFQGGVARSDDGVRTWKASNSGMPPSTVATHIVLDPRSPRDRRTLYVTGMQSGVFKSTDDGRTWVLRNSGLEPNPRAWRLTMLPDGTLFLLTSRGLLDQPGAIYKSTDGAGTWRNVAMPDGADAPNELVFDPSNPKRMYLACWPKPEGTVERGGGVYSTEDGATTWKRIFDESAHAYSIAVDPRHTDTLFMAGFDSAAYRSDNRGQSWRKLEGFDFKWAHRPVPDPYHPGMLYITTFGSSVWYGSDGR